MFVNSGLVGPKLRLKSVDDGHPVNIPELSGMRYYLASAYRSKVSFVTEYEV